MSTRARAAAIFAGAREMDALLLGRRTYDIFAAYWPNVSAENSFAELLNRVPKYVASRTLQEPLDWQGSTLLDGDVAAAVTGLKERHRQVHVIGSLDLTQTLLRAQLVDRLELWIYPLALGTGKRLFADGTVPTSFRLRDSAPYPERRRPPLLRAHRHADLRHDRGVSGAAEKCAPAPSAGSAAWRRSAQGISEVPHALRARGPPQTSQRR